MKAKLSLLVGAATAVLVLVALAGTSDTIRAQSFNPTIETTVDDPTAGANSSFTVNFGVPLGDVQFGGAVFFIPPEWEVTPGVDIPLAAVVGELEALATLGLINAPCDNQLTVQFKMLNGSVDIGDTVEFNDDDDNGTGDVFEDKDDSGIQDGIEKYPAFINRITDDKQPIRRSVGIEIVAGVDVMLQFLIFEPGTEIATEISSDPNLGYPTVTFLQAIGDPEAEPEPSAITDFCSPLTSTNVTFGVSKDNPCTNDAVPLDELDALCEVKSAPLEIPDEPTTEPDESGHVLFRNPDEGTFTFTAIAVGQRDADGDGIENALDTCPYDVNQGDPREKGSGDFDEDGIDAACDPNDEEINSDQDLDGYLNRQDNCPLDPNGEDLDNQEEDDVNDQGESRPDGIGNVCDRNPQTPDGELILVEATSDVTIGPSDGPPPAQTPTDGETPEPDGMASTDDDGGLGTGAIVGIVIGIIAGVIVLGGGALLLTRRGGGGGTTA